MQEINYTTYKKPSDYIKFENGDNTIVIVSKGYFRKLHGMKTVRGYIPLGECVGVGCKYCAEGSEPKTKFTWIAFLPKTKEVKIMDAGTMIGNQICEIARDKGIDPNGYQFSVTKSGAGLKTQYTVSLQSKIQLSESDTQLIEYAKKYLVKKHFTDNK